MKSLLLIFSALFIFVLFSCKSGKSGNKQPVTDTVSAKTVQTVAQGPGQQVYTKYCLACHQPDGNGMKGMFPPLAGNTKVTGPSADVITIVLSGLQGPIKVNGEEQNYSQIMPAQDYLTDQQIADVLTFVRGSFGNKAPAVSSEEVAEVRKKVKQ